jgi:hypothetical protein
LSSKLDPKLQPLATILRQHIVVLGSTIVEKLGEEEAYKAFRKLAEIAARKLKAEGKLEEGFASLAKVVSNFSPILDEEISFDLEKITCTVTKCGLYETAKQLGLEKTPLCVRCKAYSNTMLEYAGSKLRKEIVKSLWRGDDRCEMIYK